MSLIDSGIATTERFTALRPGAPVINLNTIQQINPPQEPFNVANLTHPLYDLFVYDWEKYRMVYEGGEIFLDYYLKKFSKRESNTDFLLRKLVTPIPAFAAGSINEIKNAIAERLVDVTRVNGPQSYLDACCGKNGGIDLKGSTVNWFISQYILPELLTVKRIGVFVDNQTPGLTLADRGNTHPYCYFYRAEDIRSWSYSQRGTERIYLALLLRDYDYVLAPNTNLPIGEVERYRYFYVNPDDGYVHLQFFDRLGQPENGEMTLAIKEIPFHMFEISESLLKNVANHQIALLNMESSDVSFTLRANYPYYIEQFDSRTQDRYIKSAQQAYQAQIGADPNSSIVDPTACGPEIEGSDDIVAGATVGRRYGAGLNAPAFINPSPEPLKASMDKQRSLKDDIRTLVHLTLSSIKGSRVSAESKQLDLQGTESGLAIIGSELEHGERQIAKFWSMYEANPTVAEINYPQRYSLKTFQDIIGEVNEMIKVRDKIPSRTYKQQVNMMIAKTLLANGTSWDTLNSIYKEIQSAKYMSGDVNDIKTDISVGIVGLETAAEARGYDPSEVDKANADHLDRITRIAQAQTSGAALQAAALQEAGAELKNPAARGVPDLSPNPVAEAEAEKTGKPGRGPA